MTLCSSPLCTQGRGCQAASLDSALPVCPELTRSILFAKINYFFVLLPPSSLGVIHGCTVPWMGRQVCEGVMPFRGVCSLPGASSLTRQVMYLYARCPCQILSGRQESELLVSVACAPNSCCLPVPALMTPVSNIMLRSQVFKMVYYDSKANSARYWASCQETGSGHTTWALGSLLLVSVNEVLLMCEHCL